VRPELAGKKVKCPKCSKIVLVPAEEVEELVEVEEKEQRIQNKPAQSKRAEKKEERVQSKPAKRKREEEEEEEQTERKSGKYKPCPRCGAKGARKVKWTAWGSFYGPAMFTHVRCPECEYAYNGKTGGSNLIPAIIFVTVPLLGILAAIGFIVYVVVVRRF
jgi:hypothetical protein